MRKDKDSAADFADPRGTHFEDLSPCTYVGSPLWPVNNLQAVGWLHPDHAFAKGTVPGVYFDSLLRLFENLWQPVFAMGYQTCAFCPLESTRTPQELEILSGRFVARRLLSNGLETFEVLGPETEIFQRQNNNPNILEINMGAANLFVPARGFIFVAPSLILHYIHTHGYKPPSVFWDAVLACPPMRSDAYMEAIRSNTGSSKSS